MKDDDLETRQNYLATRKKVDTTYFIDLLNSNIDVVYLDRMLMCDYLDIRYSDRQSYLKAVIYARFSSSGQKDESITAQVREVLERYCKVNKVIPIIAIYTDYAKTGTNANRNAYQLMCTEIVANIDNKDSDIDLCLVYKSDRLSRYVGDVTAFEKLMQKYRKKLISLTEPEMFQSDANSKFMTTIKLRFNSFYSDQLSEVVHRGHKEAAKRSFEMHGTCTAPVCLTIEFLSNFSLQIKLCIIKI